MKQILVVDDEPMIVEIVCAALEDGGFKATPATSFDEAQQILSSPSLVFDCLVVDKNLGAGGSGWDVARVARSRMSSVAVVYISGEDARNWASEGVPGSVMVQKPFSADGILTAVNRLLEKSGQLEAVDRGRSSSWRDVDVLKELFEDGPGFMAVGLGQEPRFTFANKAYRQLVGNRPLIGLTVAEALPEVAAQGILDILARVHKSGEPFVAYGMPLSLAATGGRTEQKFVDVIFHALSNEAGATIGLAAQGRDVTQQRETERRLGALRSAIIENARIKTMDALASAIAHELNQPLTAISNDMWTAQQLLKKHEGDSGLAACLLRAEASAARAGKIIRKLRQMASKGPPETERFDLRSISVDAIELGTTGISKVSVKYHDHPDMEVIGDPVQIQQVLINLVRNACDAIGDQGSIDVIASRVRGFVSICVNDTGTGIPGDILPVIFDAFATTKAKGMGIGLSICKEIVEAHGGRISAQNLPSGGASICFTVPLAVEMHA